MFELVNRVGRCKVRCEKLSANHLTALSVELLSNGSSEQPIGAFLPDFTVRKTSRSCIEFQGQSMSSCHCSVSRLPSGYLEQGYLDFVTY